MSSHLASAATFAAELIGIAICKPQVHLGRWRHDGLCDRCGSPIDVYAGERLDFPLDDLSSEASSSREKLAAMWNAEYERVCFDCYVTDDEEVDDG
jgi:hypothetical protein